VSANDQAALNVSELTPRTKPGEHYLPPRIWEVEKAFTAQKMKPQCMDMLADVINMMDPEGTFTSQENDFLEAEKYVARNPPRTNTKGKYTLFNGEETLDAGKAKEDAMTTRVRYHQNCRDFVSGVIDEIGFRNIPGGSPLNRAIGLIRMLQAKQGNDGENGMPSAFSQPGGYGQNSLVSEIKEAIQQARDIQRDPATKDLMGYGSLATEDDGNGGGGNPNDETAGVEIALDMLTGKAVMEKIARNLNQLSRMTIGRSHKREPDFNGNVLDPRTMQEVNQLPRMATSEWAYNKKYRNYRILSQTARMYEPCVQIEKKQLIYNIVDRSGSMGGIRTWIAGGCIMRGLQAVYKGDAELYLRFFDTKLKAEWHADTPQKAKEVMQTMLKSNHAGGGTSIAPCARGAVARIKELMAQNPKMAKPELLIVSDGDDNTQNLTPDDFPGIKMHAVIIHGTDEHLCRLARLTGGVGIKVDANSH
jgi:Mg-chelatase subunit ChlD